MTARRLALLALIGRIPTSTETCGLLPDRGPNNRIALIDELLADPEHAPHMATVFDVMLMGWQASTLVPQAEWHEFLRRSFQANTPYKVTKKPCRACPADDTCIPLSRQKKLEFT